MHAHEPTRRTNLIVLALLMALLAMTVGALLLNVPGRLGIAVAMSIAAAKAALVVSYFMHVRYESALVRAFAAAGAVWLGILFVFVVLEVATR